ncbi:DUF6449 domain-containing protein [Falsibacillus albus]|uniref:Multidrug ABC transporter permease n=1 Tax=Falsibacillus albus TaxID=2478915 RepID=A0A3L7JSK1_9BACI|nr:DUF6449 domain-containing protein [Falsibacillus albus]RLQ93304.1 multidrug ABC transporter permease [Falsibacillus albus]
MPSKTSSINREIFKQINRSVGWVGIIYFLGLLFSLPLQIQMLYSPDRNFTPMYDSLFDVVTEFQFILFLVIPVMLSVFLFRYMQVKKSSDMMHSLPIKREKLLFHYSAVGSLYLIVPVVLTAVIIMIQVKAMELSEYIQVHEIFVWVGATLLINAILYTSGIFVGMLTGISAVQAVLTYIFLIFPAGIMVLFCFNLDYFLIGFPQDYFLGREIEKYSPLIRSINLKNSPLSGTEIWLYIGVTVILYLASIYLYKQRKLEGVSQALSFPILKPIFKYCVAFCTMLVGGAYFGQMQHDWSWAVFGYIAGSIMGYYLAEMLLQKAWRITFHWKGFAGYAVFVLFLGVLFHWDVFQYGTKVPKLDNIEKVHLSEWYYTFEGNRSPEEVNKPKFLKSVENIKRVQELQKAIAENEKGNHFKKYAGHHVQTSFIVYYLKNGKKIVRQYTFDSGKYDKYLKPIYESTEYKKTKDDILNVKNDDADFISVESGQIEPKKIVISDPEKVKQAMDALKKDAVEESYESMKQQKDSFYRINVHLNDNKNIFISMDESQQRFKEWLTSEGLFQQIEITENDVSKIIITDAMYFNMDKYVDTDTSKRMEELVKDGKGIKFSGKSEIEQMLKKAIWSGGNKYVSAIYFNDSKQPEIYYHGKEGVPVSILGQLK